MPVGNEFIGQTNHLVLGPEFFDQVEAAEFPKTTLRYRNDKAAGTVGLDSLTNDEWINHFGQFEMLPGSFEKPLALRYHGHQFQHYNPDLGDGRGFLFAQMRDLNNNRLLDFGTKGSGQTPWSRAGDGRLTLKGGVREILAGTMLETLGVNTSKSFSLIETHEQLMRGDEPSPTRSGVLVRLSHSHIRIGTFQRLSHLGLMTEIARLIDYCIIHYMPHCAHKDGTRQTLNFLKQVCENVAQTGADWMQAGFVHGVLNTDNINITGESFDYGPWRFAPTCEPGLTAAYFDENGLYAFARQPSTLLWNLTRLAECLTSFAPNKELEAVLEQYSQTYTTAFIKSLLRRLGLASRGEANDHALAKAFWDFLEETNAPFEQVYFDWYGGTASTKKAMNGPNGNFYKGSKFTAMNDAMSNYDPTSGVVPDHRYFDTTTPQTMLIDEVEQIWAPIASDDNWSLFDDKMAKMELMRDALLG